MEYYINKHYGYSPTAALVDDETVGAARVRSLATMGHTAIQYRQGSTLVVPEFLTTVRYCTRYLPHIYNRSILLQLQSSKRIAGQQHNDCGVAEWQLKRRYPKS